MEGLIIYLVISSIILFFIRKLIQRKNKYIKNLELLNSLMFEIIREANIKNVAPKDLENEN